MLVVIIGTLIYLIEGASNGFTSIPQGIYWAIVTLTTVGYGDITPVTPLGKFLASIVMILGYGIIAVPTGIVTAEMANQREQETTDKKSSNISKSENKECPECGQRGHRKSAKYCDHCGAHLF